MLGSCLRLGSLWLCLPHAGKGHCFRGLPSHTHLIMGAGWDREVSLVADI